MPPSYPVIAVSYSNEIIVGNGGCPPEANVPTDPAAALATLADVLFDPADVVECRTIDPAKARDGASRWTPAADLHTLAGWAAGRNAGGFGVFVGVCPRVARGRKGNAAVPFGRVLFADHDHTSVQQAAAAVAAALLPPPTLTLWSGHGTHHYWRLAEPLVAEFWPVWQKDLAAVLRSDPSVHNPERVARAPGFDNTKRRRVPCGIVECDPSRVYPLFDLPIPMRAGSDAPTPVFVVRRAAPREDDDGRPGRVERCRRYLSKLPRAVSGEHGHDRTFNAANVCNRFGLTEAEAVELMAWFSGDRCDPPWTPAEVERKVRHAYRNTAEHGTIPDRDSPAGPVYRVRLEVCR